MKPGAPWSIKGVDTDAREVAKAKARAADMTLGQWLNRAIAEADKPQAAPAPAAPPQGSSLDTARLMRAISEVARRVDQVRENAAGPAADTGRLEAAIEQIGRRLQGLEQSLATGPDLSVIADRIDAMNNRLDTLDERDVQAAPVPDLSEGLAPLKADLQRMMNGMLNLARKIDTVDQRAQERLAPLQEQLQAISAESSPPPPPPANDPRIDLLRDEIAALREAVTARADDPRAPEPREPAPDIGAAVTAAMAPLLAKLADMEGRLEAVQAQPAPAPVAPMPEQEAPASPEAVQGQDAGDDDDADTEHAAEPAAPEVGTDSRIVVADDRPAVIDPPAASDATGLSEPEFEPEPEPEPEAPAPETGSGMDDDDAPMRRPEPGAIQALHDLTASRRSVSRPVEPILRDLPTENLRDLDDDDRPDFDQARTESGDEAQETATGPEAASPADSEAAPADDGAFAGFDGQAVRGLPEDETEIPSDHGPADAPAPARPQTGQVRDDVAHDDDTDIPAAAAPPDRPRRIVPVESLLAGGADGASRAAVSDDYETRLDDPAPTMVEPERQERRVAGMAATAGPMAGGPARVEQPRRRRGAGYLLVALLFLAVLVGGFFLIGDARFNDWVAQGRQLVAALTGTGQPGGDEPVADAGNVAATPSAVSNAPASAPPAGADAGQAAGGQSGGGQTVPPVTTAEAAPQPSASAQAPASDPAPAAAPAPAPEQVAVAPAAPAAPEAPVAAPAPAPAPPSDDLATLQARADAGDAEAQYRLGVRYRDGDGVGVSYAESAQWFQRAAEQGHVPAQVDLGIFYRQGVGVAKDLDLAKVWFHAAARAGHPEAQNFLGQVYVSENEDRPDYFQAARWFREAAEQGVLDAQFNLASLYMGGFGVPRDDAQAYFWFGIAARQGDQDAVTNQQNMAALISPAEREEQDQRIAAFQPVEQYRPAERRDTATVSVPVAGSGELRRRDQIRLLQRLLISRGYSPGEPDGLPGEQTREAIRQFEADSGLPVSGRITEAVLQALQAGG